MKTKLTNNVSFCSKEHVVGKKKNSPRYEIKLIQTVKENRTATNANITKGLNDYRVEVSERIVRRSLYALVVKSWQPVKKTQDNCSYRTEEATMS